MDENRPPLRIAESLEWIACSLDDISVSLQMIASETAQHQLDADLDA